MTSISPDALVVISARSLQEQGAGFFRVIDGQCEPVGFSEYVARRIAHERGVASTGSTLIASTSTELFVHRA